MLLAATSVPSFLQAGEKQPTLSIKNQKIAIDSQWDVIVVGGGPAGCTAATAAAREGAKTLLIEATGQLGGMGTTGMIPAWCPFSDGEKSSTGDWPRRYSAPLKKEYPTNQPIN